MGYGITQTWQVGIYDPDTASCASNCISLHMFISLLQYEINGFITANKKRDPAGKGATAIEFKAGCIENGLGYHLSVPCQPTHPPMFRWNDEAADFMTQYPLLAGVKSKTDYPYKGYPRDGVYAGLRLLNLNGQIQWTINVPYVVAGVSFVSALTMQSLCSIKHRNHK